MYSITDLTPGPRALLSDFAHTANGKGLIKNLRDLTPQERVWQDELVDAELIVRHDEHTAELLVSKAEAILHRPLEVSSPSAAVSSPATSSELKTSGVGASQRLRRTLTDKSEICQEAISEDVEGPRKKSFIDQALALPVESWNNAHLAAYFSWRLNERAVEQRVALGPSPINFNALKGHFHRWKRDDGLSNADIKGMVDAFMLDLSRFIKRNKPAWQTFLARRQRLFVDGKRLAQQDHVRTEEEWLSHEETTHNTSYWIGT